MFLEWKGASGSRGTSRDWGLPRVACGCMGNGLVTMVSAADPKGAYARLSMSTLPCPWRAAFACATSTGDEKFEADPVTKGEATSAARKTHH